MNPISVIYVINKKNLFQQTTIVQRLDLYIFTQKFMHKLQINVEKNSVPTSGFDCNPV